MQTLKYSAILLRALSLGRSLVVLVLGRAVLSVPLGRSLSVVARVAYVVGLVALGRSVSSLRYSRQLLPHVLRPAARMQMHLALLCGCW